MSGRTYIFTDIQQEQEWERLTAIQDEFDCSTCRRLKQLGIRSGWSCLEVGPGAGSIMRWMCEQVGEQGRVVAVDLNTRFVSETRLANLDVRQMDIATTEIEASSFDLIHARYVLLHIHEYEKALSNIVRALKPGGWLLLEEPHFTTAKSASRNLADAGAVDRVFAAILQMYESMGIDPALGRKLPSLFQSQNLQAIDVETELPLVRGGSGVAKIMKMSVEHLAQRLVATAVTSKDDIERYVYLSDDPTA